MDYEPETMEESGFLNCLCEDIGVCSEKNVGRCNTCNSILEAVKERAVFMPLAADHKPIMPGQSVRNIYNGDRFRVQYVKCFEDATVVVVRYKNYGPFVVTADSLTHVRTEKDGDRDG